MPPTNFPPPLLTPESQRAEEAYLRETFRLRRDWLKAQREYDQAADRLSKLRRQLGRLVHEPKRAQCRTRIGIAEAAVTQQRRLMEDAKRTYEVAMAAKPKLDRA